jgi:hypothetical protein
MQVARGSHRARRYPWSVRTAAKSLEDERDAGGCFLGDRFSGEDL